MDTNTNVNTDSNTPLILILTMLTLVIQTLPLAEPEVLWNSGITLFFNT